MRVNIWRSQMHSTRGEMVKWDQHKVVQSKRASKWEGAGIERVLNSGKGPKKYNQKIRKNTEEQTDIEIRRCLLSGRKGRFKYWGLRGEKKGGKDQQHFHFKPSGLTLYFVPCYKQGFFITAVHRHGNLCWRPNMLTRRNCLWDERSTCIKQAPLDQSAVQRRSITVPGRLVKCKFRQLYHSISFNIVMILRYKTCTILACK